MEVRPLSESGALASLLRQSPMQPFLQSWAWGDFQHNYGRRIWRLGAFDGETLVGAMTLIEHRLMLGKSYLYCPRGPVAQTMEALLLLAAEALSLGKKVGAMYVKIDPAPYSFPFVPSQFVDYEPGTTLQEPETLVLDLAAGEDELLANMHQKTRYNIRLAEKRGVTVRWSTTDADYETYVRLQKEMADRQGIRPHPDRYYRVMFETYRVAGLGELAVAEFEGKPLAINFVLWNEQTAIFIHGGSTQEHKEVMAPYELQWASIREAKKRGMRWYDFRGIAPENAVEHKLAGVTRFKLGFGGRRVSFPSAMNVILDRPWWMMYRFAKRMRSGLKNSD